MRCLKYLPPLIATLLITTPSPGQDTVHHTSARPQQITPAQRHKPGVYKTFREFQTNSPSIIGKVIIRQRSAAAQVYLLASRNELHIVNEDGQELKVKDYWGYSDGQDIFIRDNGLNKLAYIAAYSPYEITGIGATPGYYNPNDPRVNNVATTYRKRRVVNIYTGQQYDLTSFYLRKYILADDNHLLEAFRNDKNREERLEYYLQLYNQRRQVE